MTELGWHLMHRLIDDRAFLPTPADLRLASRIVLERGLDYDLLSFGFADNHLHTLVTCDRRRAGRFAQVVETALHKRLQLQTPFAPFFPEAVRRQAHLVNTFRYCIRQDELHRVHRDPLHEGTILPSLLGLRALGSWATLRVRRHLPRIDRSDLLELAPALAALGRPEVSRDWDLLLDSAASAIAVPELTGRAPPVVQARRAAVHVASGAVGPGRIAGLLRTSRATVERMRASTPDPAVLRAVDLQLRVRSAAA